MLTRSLFIYALCFSGSLICCEPHKKSFSSSVDLAEYTDTLPAKKQKTQETSIFQGTVPSASLWPTGSIKPDELYRPIRNNRTALYLQLCELHQARKNQPELSKQLTPYINWLYKTTAPMYEQPAANTRNRDF